MSLEIKLGHHTRVGENAFREICGKSLSRPRKVSDDSSNSSGYGGSIGSGSEFISLQYVATSGILDSFSSKSYDQDLVYRLCNFSNTQQIAWTSPGGISSAPLFNNEAYSPSGLLATSCILNKSFPAGNSVLNVDDKTTFFRKCLRYSLLPEFENHPEKMRLINGEFNNVCPQPTLPCAASSSAASMVSSPSEMPDMHSIYGFATEETWRVCHFCLKNGEPEIVYSAHELKGPDGLITCPVLRRYVCELCGATGSYSHTKRYCPLYVAPSN